MKRIIILLSTYNGVKYLKNQIDSLMSQSYDDFRIIARDDGSSDESSQILKSYDMIEIVDSQQNLGAKGSFAELLEYAVKHTEGEFFMFCDQDDVWKNDKIEKTLAKMQEMRCLLLWKILSVIPSCNIMAFLPGTIFSPDSFVMESDWWKVPKMMQ